MNKKISVFLILSFLLSASLVWANPVKALFEEAIQAYSSRDYQKAITILEKINEIYPNFAPTYNYLGLCYKDTGVSGGDIKWLFEKAIEIDPNYADPYDNLAKLYYSLTEFDKAQEYGLKAVALNPDFTTAHLTLGWVYLLGKSQPQDAIDHFKKVVEGNAELPFAQFGLGMAYHMQHQNFKVLEMVTNLRHAGREDLALQLEQVIRAGKYQTQLIPGMPLIAQPKPTEQIKEENLSFSDDEQIKKTPVRLGGAVAADTESDADGAVSNSPQDRLRELRRRGLQVQQGGVH